jgi:hypothetical protein
VSEIYTIWAESEIQEIVDKLARHKFRYRGVLLITNRQ